MLKKHKVSIHFSGTPDNLTADVSMPRIAGMHPVVQLKQGSQPLQAFGDNKIIHKLVLTMPGDTPPGTIETCVEFGKSTYDALIEVQQRTALRFEPATLNLRAAAGDTVTTTLNVTNIGNGALSCVADPVVTLRPAGTLARSIVKEFKQESSDFTDRLIAIGKGLSTVDSHELAVACHMKTTTLNTGESTMVELELGVPDDLLPDSKWTGSMALLGARVRIDVEIPTLR